MKSLALGIVGLAAALVGCEREVRSQSYFEAHDAERAEVLADCKTGAHTGEECRLAQLAAQAVAKSQKHTTRRAILQQTIEAEPAKK